MGVGMASVYATGMLWLENRTPVTSRIGALLSIFASLGPDVFPVVVGQFIDREPMVMVYVTLAAVAVCAMLFAAASALGMRLQAQRKAVVKADDEEMKALKT